MNLTLEILSQNGQSLGPQRRKVFGEGGGRIGRAQDCDWVLPDPYISRHHATVHCIGGTYYIESTGENGVAIGSPQAMIPQRERRALHDGERLYIDEYEVAVAIAAATAEATPRAAGAAALGLIPGDPFADVAQAERVPATPDALEPTSDELDPLKRLPRRAPAAASAGRRAASSWNDTPGISDHFAPPPVPAPVPSLKTAGSSAAIPDDWNRTGYNRGDLPAPAPRRRDFAMPQPRAAAAASVPSGTPPAAFDTTAFLRAAGVDPAAVPPETAAELGQILRAVVQGVMEVLKARAEVKLEFRLPLTRIKAAENNPLKFAVNADDALHSLLGPRSAGYLAPAEAFADALDDIRFHQMAMLAGMRAAFEHTLRRFDPAHLAEAFAKRAHGRLWKSGESGYWQLYAQEFGELAADPDEAFKRLFGEEFAGAYEKQLENLKRGGNGIRH